MSNSPLVSYTRISPNKNSPRNHAIDTITIHCVVGQCSVETLGNIFTPTSRQASSNYGIGYDGKIGMYVEEKTVPGVVLPRPTITERSRSKSRPTQNTLTQSMKRRSPRFLTWWLTSASETGSNALYGPPTKGPYESPERVQYDRSPRLCKQGLSWRLSV